MKNKQFDKAFFKFRKLLIPYFYDEYGKETIEVAFQYAYDYFYELLEKLEKGEEENEKK